MTDVRTSQTVAAALNAVRSAKERVVVIDPLRDPRALADAVISQAETDGLSIDVDLLDDGISIRPRLSGPTN